MVNRCFAMFYSYWQEVCRLSLKPVHEIIFPVSTGISITV